MTREEFHRRYTIDHSKVKSGSFGSVYHAYDNYLDEHKAIKVAQIKVIGDKEYTLESEVEITNDLAVHKNIAHYESVYRFKEPNGEFSYAVMQLYQEGNLKDLLKNQNLSLERKKELAQGIIEGVSFLHDNGIFHRDLKPNNILISKRKDQYIPKISDFGISKVFDDFDLSNSGIGWTSYSSPELLKGLRLTKDADLWSVGIILYELFLGRHPFVKSKDKSISDSGVRGINRAIVQEPMPSDVALIPNPFNLIASHYLNKEPGKRYVDISAYFKDETTAPEMPNAAPAVSINDDTVPVERKKKKKRRPIFLPLLQNISSGFSSVGAMILGLMRSSISILVSNVKPIAIVALVGMTSYFAFQNQDQIVGSGQSLVAGITANFQDVFEKKDNGEDLLSSQDSSSTYETRKEEERDRVRESKPEKERYDIEKKEESGETKSYVAIVNKQTEIEEVIKRDVEGSAKSKNSESETLVEYEQIVPKENEIVDDVNGNNVESATVNPQEGYQEIKEISSEIKEIESEGPNEKTKSEALPAYILDISKDMVKIPSGSFTFGCDSFDKDCDKDEMDVKEMAMTSYEIMAHEVTQQLYESVTGKNPSAQKGCATCPVEQVSWYDAKSFIKKLNTLDSKYYYKLPSEAEWEYAATAGKTFVFSGGDSKDLDHYAINRYNSEGRPVQVSGRRSNAFGLFDMTGNVNEWCDNDYENTGQKSIRGGSYKDKEGNSRINNRRGADPASKFVWIGFRVMRKPK